MAYKYWIVDIFTLAKQDMTTTNGRKLKPNEFK